MGMNTVIVVLNDLVQDIRDNPRFGREVADAVTSWPYDYDGNRVGGRGFRIISMSHALDEQLVSVSGNRGGLLPQDEREAVYKARRKKAKNAPSVAEEK